jgi:anti-sigma-K factor RskA
MKENQNIDELLNSFIDGELSQRHQTEVERLIAHDPQIEKRLRNLQKVRVLVSSLPRAEAPDEMAEMTKASLERRTLLDQQPERFEDSRGARDLLARKVLSAAAMIILVAALAAVVYTIIAPDTATRPPVAVEDWQQPGVVATAEKAASPITAPVSTFNARLELKTTASVAVDAFIKRAIDDNSLAIHSGPQQQDQSLYVVSCGKEGLKSLLTDLASIWDRFDSATLFVDTDRVDGQIVIETVTAQQIVQIAAQDEPQERVRLAKDFAVLNSLAEHLQGKDVLTAIDDKSPDLRTIPKPVLTSRQEAAKQQAGEVQDPQPVHFTIVIEDIE